MAVSLGYSLCHVGIYGIKVKVSSVIVLALVIGLVLAKRGHRVFAITRDTANIPETLSRLQNVTVTNLDVGDTVYVAAAAPAVADGGRGQHILINITNVSYIRPCLTSISPLPNIYTTSTFGDLCSIS
ncbi:hypothetical protein F5Y08DRAFT_343534 [Xylaria arbuscula]|nr:hypothetical protein F5Y08DRAFT_343534 [Xylaria arbuscula]